MRDPRSNHALHIEARGDRELVITRSFDAPRELVFRAFTDPALVVRWLGTPETPMVDASIDLTVGGKIRYAWKGEAFAMTMTGTFIEVHPPARLVHTELFDEDWTSGEAVNTTRFDEHDGVTTVTIVMRYVSTEARDAVVRSPMEQGMTTNYNTLERLLTSGELEE